MFSKVVVANRGAVAARVLRALYAMGIKSVAVYSEADYGAPYLEMASETYAIGASPAADSYLNQDTLLALLQSVWERRADRYSEQRASLHAGREHKVEMFHIGG